MLPLCALGADYAVGVVVSFWPLLPFASQLVLNIREVGPFSHN